ncbi:hypothetical protein DL96DRAFT_904698 [Flagelloscypha sp. PMI_526]|nr:hypothetical protein DL96DRAFT_904698 [Flagelloscypha sp. PMI_526]
MAPSHSCKCLNIRISVSEAGNWSGSTTSAAFEKDTSFEAVHIAEKGISVAHPQLTIRVLGRPFQAPQSTERARVTTVHCLVCNIPFYRVQRLGISISDDAEGPIIPSETSALDGILMSEDGWIQVTRDALTSAQITDAESRPEYSSVFHVLIPTSPPLSMSSSGTDESLSYSPPRRTQSPNSFFSEQQLFPPPPFSPKHPAFQHLTALAQDRSTRLRTAAEATIRSQLNKVDEEERDLQKQTELIWMTFKQHVAAMETRSGTTTAPAGSGLPVSRLAHTASSNGAPSASISIRDFVPEPVKPRMVSANPATTGPNPMSSLSASLKTSNFQPPPTTTHEPAPSDKAISSPISTADLISPSSSGPRPAASGTIERSGGASVLNFRRIKEDDRDVAASYKVLLNIEQNTKASDEKAKQNAKHSPDAPPKPDASSSSSAIGDLDSATPTNGGITKNSPGVGSSQKSSSPGKSKAKRTVTFNVGTAAEQNKETLPSTSSNPVDDMVFDLEEEDGRYLQREEKPPAPVEHVPRPDPRRRKIRRNKHAGLPNSYAVLRPSSLPAPSTLRNLSRSLPAQPVSVRQPQSLRPLTVTNNEEYDPREIEILSLVGANVPSHRGLYRKGGPAWQKIIEGKRLSEDLGDDDFSSTDDEDSYGPQFAVGSLPIPVHSFGKRDVQQELSVASYQPGAELMALPSQSLPATSGSSKSIRRARYAERDRARSIDPGHLAFVVEEDGDDNESLIGPPDSDEQQSGQKSDKAALRILQKRAEIPDAGMWRSLAE